VFDVLRTHFVNLDFYFVRRNKFYEIIHPSLKSELSEIIRVSIKIRRSQIIAVNSRVADKHSIHVPSRLILVAHCVIVSDIQSARLANVLTLQQIRFRAGDDSLSNPDRSPQKRYHSLVRA